MLKVRHVETPRHTLPSSYFLSKCNVRLPIVLLFARTVSYAYCMSFNISMVDCSNISAALKSVVDSPQTLQPYYPPSSPPNSSLECPVVVMEGTPHLFLLSPMPSLANFSYVNLYPSAKNKASLKEFRQWPQPPRTPPPPPPSVPTTEPPSISVLLTVYKRNRLTEQLAAIAAQSVTPAAVYVFQNENHVDIPMASLIHKYRDEPWPLHHIHSVTMNQKYHGRFAFANMISQSTWLFSMTTKSRAPIG